jgi:hypothetical protein
MLRKASHIILSFLLLFTTIGFVVSKHYCGGTLISTSLFVEADSCCDSDGCCKNETHFYQLDEDYSILSLLELPEIIQVNLFANSLVVFNLNLEEIITDNEFLIDDSSSPPKIQTILALKQSYLL